MAADFATALRRLMAERGLSQRSLARQVPLDPGQLSRILNGKRPPTPGLAARCDEILGSGDQLQRATRRQAWRHAAPDAAVADDADAADAVPADSGRRALLAGLALVAAGAGLLTRADVAARRLGASDIARIEAVTTLYRSMDYEVGGGLLVDDVGRFAEATSQLLNASYPAALAPALLTAVAGARQLAGWTAFDAGRHSDAGRHFLSAERAAVAADDALLAARIRYCQARQYQHLRHNTDALDTLRLARAHLGAAATPAVRAMLHGAEAASLAALGDQAAALLALGAAQESFDRIRPDDEPDWMAFFDEGELLAQYGRVYRDLARTDPRYGQRAVDRVRQAIAAFGPQNQRSAALNEVGLCSALFLADDPAQAVAVGHQAAARADQISSRRLLDRLTNVRRDLTLHQRQPDVAAFARGLATLAAPAG